MPRWPRTTCIEGYAIQLSPRYDDMTMVIVIAENKIVVPVSEGTQPRWQEELEDLVPDTTIRRRVAGQLSTYCLNYYRWRENKNNPRARRPTK